MVLCNVYDFVSIISRFCRRWGFVDVLFVGSGFDRLFSVDYSFFLFNYIAF